MFKRQPSVSHVACKLQRRRTFVELKRTVRCLLKFPRAVLVFEEQELPKELNGWVDADFAGDLVSRRSSSGLVVLFGRHCLKTSSGKSEFYACVKGGAAFGTNVYVFDRCINVNNGTLAEGAINRVQLLVFVF